VASIERRVLVTGAPGNIASYFVDHAPERYRLRMLVQSADERSRRLEPRGEVVVGDLADAARMREACVGIDTVLHLAACPNPEAEWPEVLAANIVGAYHMFAAAKAAGCRRLIFASSIHAVIGHPAETPVCTGDPVNPGNLYGVSKCFGEALGRYYAEREGLSVIAVRIGAFQPRESLRTPWGRDIADIYVSPRDLHQLICRCIDDVDIRFAIVHGASANRRNRLDLADTRACLGYEPQDDAFAELERPPS
jgi:nucleoside-diphosphate-sugar epimerase